MEKTERMVTAKIGSDVLRFLAGKKDIGESYTDVLRRLLALPAPV